MVMERLLALIVVMIHVNSITCMLWSKSSAGFMPQVN